MNSHNETALGQYELTQAYLKLSSAYSEYLGGLRWSSEDDTLVYADGRCFAFSEAIAAFLEGFSGSGRVIPFVCVLHWLDLLLRNRPRADARSQRLHQAFQASGQPWRNAGAFAAALSDGVPEPAVPPALDQVCDRLRDQTFPIRWFVARFHESSLNPAELPGITPQEFEALVLGRVAAFSDAELMSWLRDGRGPLHKAGQALVQELPRPRSLAGALAALLLRPRLAGAETYVTRLVGALTLPPRRLAPQQLPVGGYADMTTRGDVEQLLPSQHALDDLEFVRRYAERELLYFRREEPPAQNRQELHVLLDQGVRTWGDVRLMLAAAALALGKQAARRTQPFRLAATSNQGRLLDPAEVDDALLGEVIEASDLSFQPGAALEAVLEQPCPVMRDVVLLTHPRNLREADVLTAARRAGPRDRIFTVTVDETGEAGLGELRRGAVVPLRRFRVEFDASQPTPRAVTANDASKLPPWTGDVEAVPFPFRFGTEGPIAHFDFDHDGRSLLTVSSQGMLYIWPTQGEEREVLPRARRAGGLFGNPYQIIGVAGGFVLLEANAHGWAAAHYDLGRRHCRVWQVETRSGELSSAYYVPEEHTVCLGLGPPDFGLFALDLRKTEGSPVPLDGLHTLHWSAFAARPTRRCVASASGELTCAPPLVQYRIDTATGAIECRRASAEVASFTPVADGKPLLKSALLYECQAAGDTLAVSARLADQTVRLLLVRGSTGQMLGEHRDDPLGKHRSRFLLSLDGQWLAREWGERIALEKIDAPGVRTLTRCGGYNANIQVGVGERRLVFRCGLHKHVVHWSATTVEFACEKPDAASGSTPVARPGVHWDYPLDFARTYSVPAVPFDGQRFVGIANAGGLVVALDRYGQIVVMRMDGTVICMFMVFRAQLAAWLPDGSYCGSPSLALRPEAPGARARLAKALQELSA